MKSAKTTAAQTRRCEVSVRTTLVIAGLLIGGLLPAKGANMQPVTGNIQPYSIEIDASANLYPSGTSGFDWVKDSLPNTDPGSLSDSIATGIIPNITGVAGGKGHWNGVRIVDGVDGNEKDIFLNGGKENDTGTWSIGPGSVGSPKYDITQAYLANNQASLFFGMERRGNNGTTAFDFEFNQSGPSPAAPYIPTRTVGDVLFTFEMTGSGSSGSAISHFFIWNGSKYVEQIPAPSSLISSINTADTQAAPWGYVNSKGAWVSGNIPRFEFAEASVKLAEAFPDFSPCAGSVVFVQVRTRSSATDTSDLKDATKIFPFQFGGPEPVASLGTGCTGQLLFDASDSRETTGGTNLTYLWSFAPPAGVMLSGASISGPDANGVYFSTAIAGVANVQFPVGTDSAIINVNLAVTEGGSCTVGSDFQFTVSAPLAVAITRKEMSGSTLTVTLTATASPGTTAYQWQRLDASNTWTNISGATSSTLAYSSFEAHATPTIQDLVIAGDPYQGRVYQVQIRVHAERTINGLTCAADSAPVNVKKVIAVDP